jgi:hypothetical protein
MYHVITFRKICYEGLKTDTLRRRGIILHLEHQSVGPSVLRIRIQDPGSGIRGPGSGAFLTPRSGMGEKSGAGSGMNNPDHIS